MKHKKYQPTISKVYIPKFRTFHDSWTHKRKNVWAVGKPYSGEQSNPRITCGFEKFRKYETWRKPWADIGDGRRKYAQWHPKRE